MENDAEGSLGGLPEGTPEGVTAEVQVNSDSGLRASEHGGDGLHLSDII